MSEKDKTKTESPFIPGAQVAILHHGFSAATITAKHTIAKVYKNGNFVLEGWTGQQWRPSPPGQYSKWNAHPTGSSWSQQEIVPVDSEAYRAALAETRREKLIIDILGLIPDTRSRLRDYSDDQLKQLHDFLTEFNATMDEETA